MWSGLVALVSRLRFAVVRTRVDDEARREFDGHLELLTDRYIRAGMTPEDARGAARRQFGSPMRVREEIYQMHTVGWVDTLGRDLRLALRGLRRRPGFTFAVVLTLALGIGANTAIFAVVDGVLIKPLPYPAADQLVSVQHTAPGLGVVDLRMSASQYVTYRAEGRVFAHIGLYGDGGRTLTGIGEPEQARALFVTDDVLPALGIQPQLGRLFTAADSTPQGKPYGSVILLTHSYWQRRFGGDPAVIGRRLLADSSPVEIVGVMPPEFRFLDMDPAPEVISLAIVDPAALTLDGFNFAALARLKPGVTVADANADIARMLPIWLRAWPAPPNVAGRQAFEAWRIAPVVRPLKSQVVGGAGDLLWVVAATIGMVLLIAAANVANLMLVRGESRRHERAVRTALGAGRARLARELLIECLLLAAAGALTGVALAAAALRVIVRMAPATLPRVGDIALDLRATGFATGLAVVFGVLFAALLAVRYLRQDGSPIAAATRASSASRERQRMRNSLVVIQVALALVLLVGSGLMMRTFAALLDVDAGFTHTAAVQTARVWVPPPQLVDPERVTRLEQAIVERVAALPGVGTAAFASAVPMEGPVRLWQQAIFAAGHTYAAGTTPPLRRIKTVSPGYFRAIGTALIAGRDITWSDVYGRQRVAAISENFAREMWGTPAAALGQHIREAPGAAWGEIVGVVRDVHEDAVHQPAPAFVYWPVLMEPFAGQPRAPTRAINLVIRSDDASRPRLMEGVRSAVWSVNSSMPVFLVRTMQDLYGGSMARTAFALVMLGIAAAIALLLGVVGIYGVIAYVVAQRSREMGIRLALGAAPAEVIRLFVRQGLTLTAIGATFGLLTAVALTQWMSSLLFGVERLDPPTYGAVLAVLGLAAAAASYLPARRAAAIDPVATLTVE